MNKSFHLLPIVGLLLASCTDLGSESLAQENERAAENSEPVDSVMDSPFTLDKADFYGKFWREVLTPDGKPAKGANLLMSDLAPVRIDLREDDFVIQDLIAGPIDPTNNDIRSLRVKTKELGFGLPTITGLRNAHHFIGVHESGYLNVSMKELNGMRSVQLNPWHSLRGRVSLNSQPLQTGVVVASWQPYPRMTNEWSGPLTTKDLQPMIILRAAAAVTAGKFQFAKLPRGRIRFMVLPNRQISDDRIWVEDSQLVWWETVDELSSHQQQMSPPNDFRVVTVRGRIDNSDELYVKRQDGANQDSPDRRLDQNPELRRVKILFVRQEDGAGNTLDHPQKLTTYKSVHDYFQQTAVWARPGGRREQQVVSTTVVINDDLTFSAALREGKYRAIVLVECKVNDEFEVWEDRGFSSFDFNVKIDPLDPLLLDPLAEDTLDLGTQTLKLRSDPTDDLTKRHGRSADHPPLSSRDQPTQMERFPTTETDGDLGNVLRDIAGGLGATPSDDARPLDGNIPTPSSMPESLRSFKTKASRVDKAIAELVTGLLSAGDARTRENLKKPLKTLLVQKFDAEQQARETIVAELKMRLTAAEQKVQDRATNKQAIIQQQLQRMMGLQDDGF